MSTSNAILYTTRPCIPYTTIPRLLNLTSAGSPPPPRLQPSLDHPSLPGRVLCTILITILWSELFYGRTAIRQTDRRYRGTPLYEGHLFLVDICIFYIFSVLYFY